MPVAKKGHRNVTENHILLNANRNWFFFGQTGGYLQLRVCIFFQPAKTLPCGAQSMIPLPTDFEMNAGKLT